MPSDAEIEAGWYAYVRCQGGWRESFIAALEAAEAVRGRDAVDAEARGYAAAREQAAATCESHAWARDIDWWLTVTKKDATAEAAEECAAAIRKMEPSP